MHWKKAPKNLGGLSRKRSSTVSKIRWHESEAVTCLSDSKIGERR